MEFDGVAVSTPRFLYMSTLYTSTFVLIMFTRWWVCKGTSAAIRPENSAIIELGLLYEHVTGTQLEDSVIELQLILLNNCVKHRGIVFLHRMPFISSKAKACTLIRVEYPL